jgi:hypothetical protein
MKKSCLERHQRIDVRGLRRPQHPFCHQTRPCSSNAPCAPALALQHQIHRQGAFSSAEEYVSAVQRYSYWTEAIDIKSAPLIRKTK